MPSRFHPTSLTTKRAPFQASYRRLPGACRPGHPLQDARGKSRERRSVLTRLSPAGRTGGLCSLRLSLAPSGRHRVPGAHGNPPRRHGRGRAGGRRRVSTLLRPHPPLPVTPRGSSRPRSRVCWAHGGPKGVSSERPDLEVPSVEGPADGHTGRF